MDRYWDRRMDTLVGGEHDIMIPKTIGTNEHGLAYYIRIGMKKT